MDDDWRFLRDEPWPGDDVGLGWRRAEGAGIRPEHLDDADRQARRAARDALQAAQPPAETAERPSTPPPDLHVVDDVPRGALIYRYETGPDGVPRMVDQYGEPMRTPPEHAEPPTLADPRALALFLRMFRRRRP